MNHLESSFAGKNAIWRYLIMLFAVLAAANTVGSIPLIISMLNNPSAISELSVNPNDLSPLGLGSNVALIFMLIPFIVGLATFVLLVKPLNYKTIMTVVNGNMPFRWNRFFISAGVWIVVSAIYLFVNMKLDPENFSLNNTSTTLISLIFISLLLIPFQTAFEEVLFRGYLMQGFVVIFRNRLFPLIMTSVLFGLMHALNPEVKEFGFLTMMPQYILFGLIFGIVTILDDGIESAMGLHAANNAFLCIMLTNESSALQTSAVWEQHNIQPWIEFTTMLIMGMLVILVLKTIFGWKNFSLLAARVELNEENITQIG
jgi:membrane protease YdiL (CAAX protease family)